MTLVGCGCHGSARFCRRYCSQRTPCTVHPESCWRLFASSQETQGPLLLKSFTFLNLQLLPTCCPSLQRLICVFIYFVSVCVSVCGTCVQSPWRREEGVGSPEPESSAGALSTLTCCAISPAAPYHRQDFYLCTFSVVLAVELTATVHVRQAPHHRAAALTRWCFSRSEFDDIHFAFVVKYNLDKMN